MDFDSFIGEGKPSDEGDPTLNSASNNKISKGRKCENPPSIPHVKGRAKTYPCPGCTGTFRKKQDYLIHFSKVHHPRSIPFKCEECPKSFGKSSHLKTHITRAHPKSTEHLTHKCSKCPAAFDGSEDLDRHYVKVHRVDKKRTYECPHCPKVFDKKGHFQMHLPSHSAHRPYSCHICPDVCYKAKSSLTRHLKVKHNIELGNNPLDLNIPQSKAPTDSAFYHDDIPSEEMDDSGGTEDLQIYQCEKCPKTYRLEGNLARHFANEHKPFEVTEDKTGYKCSKCDTFFAKERSYKHHLTYYHGDNPGIQTRLFRCQKCDLKFCTKKTFQIHMSDIHQVRKYMLRCDLCAKTFRTKYSLRCHIEKGHKSGGKVSKICSIRPGVGAGRVRCRDRKNLEPSQNNVQDNDAIKHVFDELTGQVKHIRILIT